MRRLTRALLLLIAIACLALLPAGCKRKRNRPRHSPAQDGMLATVVQVADPDTSMQLIKGFYGVEGSSWRWTAGHFSVSLRPPLDAQRKGAGLLLKFAIPPAVLAQLHDITVSANVNGYNLPPEKFSTTGDHTYRPDVPPAALTADVVNVDFSLDKALPPTQSDARELGVIVSTVGFEAK